MNDKSNEKNEALKALRKAKREAKQQALETLKALIEASGDVEALKALEVVSTQARKSGGGVTSEVLKAFDSETTISEGELFKRFKLGRGDMRKITRFSVKNLAPENRHYITFNEAKGEYTLEGTGKRPPANYTGFLPLKGIERYDAGAYGHA